MDETVIIHDHACKHGFCGDDIVHAWTHAFVERVRRGL